MINPNRDTSDSVLRRLREASYERMRVELKCSVELLMKDFDMDWKDLARLMGGEKALLRGSELRWKVIQGQLSLEQLNNIAHIFSAEPYIIFRPRLPWTKT